MKRFLELSYAPQRLVSFHQKVEKRQRDEAMRGAGWAMFILIVVGAVMLAVWLG